MGIQEDFNRLVGRFDGRDESAGEEAGILGEADFGLTEATGDDIPTRVKAPSAAAPRKASAPPRSGTKLERYLAEIKGNIEEQLDDLGLVAGESGFTTAGYVICDGSQAFSNAIVEMARNKPRLLKALEKTGRTANFTKVAKYVAAIAFAIMVDMETRSPYGFTMQHLGITNAYEVTHPDGPATPHQTAPTFTPPPQFN